MRRSSAGDGGDDGRGTTRARGAGIAGGAGHAAPLGGRRHGALHGEWAEVTTLALGTVGERPAMDGETVPHTTDLSSFSRRSTAEQFGRWATIATHAAGTTRAGTVVAVVDGAAWLQGFIDLHRIDAVRVLDFPHAAEHLATAAHAVWSEGSPAATAWLDQHLHALKHFQPRHRPGCAGRPPGGHRSCANEP